MCGKESLRHPQEMLALIMEVAKLLSRCNDERLKDVGLSTAQLPVLAALIDGEMHTQKELAVLARVEPPSMAQLLTRMERNGLIRRVADPENRQSNRISRTADTLDRLYWGRSIQRRGDVEALVGFTPEEVMMLMKMLHRIYANVAGLTI